MIYYLELLQFELILKGTSIMEAVAFGGKDASDTNTGTVI